MQKFLSGLAVVFLTLAVGAADAQDTADTPEMLRFRAPEDRPQLLVVGAAHFANPGRDMINQTVPDMMAPERQAEIEAVVAALTAFHPTHVAIEWPAAAQERLNELYAQYRAGEHELGVFEGEQIGFRLAAAAGLDHMDAIDWNEAGSGPEEAYDFPAYAGSHGQGALFAALLDPANTALVPLGDRTVGEWLRALNTPEALATNHRAYFDFVMIGGDDAQPGANWVGHWYGRNLRLFRNLVNLASSPDDRVVVIYGQGHGYLLRQFARESGAFEVTDVADVLPAGQ